MAEVLPQQSTETFDALVRRAEELTRGFERHPNQAVREDSLELLQAVDAIHREAILRLVELMVESGNHELIHRAAEDPRISTLFQLYDVVPLPEQLRWQEALDVAREKLRDSQADVELLVVTGGMARLRITGGYAVEESALRPIVQDAIVAVFGPNQSMRWEPRLRQPASPTLIAVSAIQPAKRQHWIRLIAVGELELNSLVKVTVEDMEVVLCRVESGYHAFPNACPGSALPLHLGRVAGGDLFCPWHSCAFDLATGKRVTGSGLDLKPLTLRVYNELVEVGLWR